MSQVKFAAAKKLIDEKNYEAARSILKTMNDDKAKAWLKRLDQIAPPPKKPKQSYAEQEKYYKEQEKYYKQENKARYHRNRKRIINNESKGFELIVIGVVWLWIWNFYAKGGNPSIDWSSQVDVLANIAGAISIIWGLSRMNHNRKLLAKIKQEEE